MKNSPKTKRDPPLFYVIAGEASGDMLGAGLVRGLRDLTGGLAQCVGIGGERMAEEGIESLFPISEMAVMGVFEILPHAPRLLRRIAQTVDDIISKNPVALITIDSKAFTMRVAKRLKKIRQEGGRQIPLIHMVAPTVWAWRPGRAKVISAFLDHLLVLFPFEPPYFERHGLTTTFVGHPAADQPKGDGLDFRIRHQIAAEAKILLVLPGSRPGEVRRLLPAFSGAVKLLAARYANLHVVIPTVSLVENMVRTVVRNWAVPCLLVTDSARKYDAFDAADVALAASGTVVLELTLARVPTVVGYKVNPLSLPIGKLLVDRESVVITNRVLERQIVPFFFQGECNPDALDVAVSCLLDNPNERLKQTQGADEVARRLKASDELGSNTAARAVLEAVGSNTV